MKTNLFGITNIQVYITCDTDALNEFLKTHDTAIIDIQCTDKWYHVIYQDN